MSGAPGALRLLAALTVAVTAVTAAGCSTDHGPASTAARPGCIEDFDPAVDYFPDKSTVLDATNFTLDYHRNYQVLTVKQPYPDGPATSYVLVRCGAPAPQLPAELAQAQQISTPVTGLYSASTTHLGMLAELDRADVVTGVADPGLVADPQVRERIAAHRTVGYAPGGQTRLEAVISAHPDVLVTGGFDDPSYPKLRAAGVAVLADAEWLEATPLGRAEWVKVFAALTGTEHRAAQVYDVIRAGYRKAAATAAGATPTAVLPGAMYQGSWSMPAGGYAARLITDAGGTYPWAAESGPPSRQLSFESVYARAGDAPVWLVGQSWATLADAVAADSRYARLAAVRAGQVWTSDGGAGDYWERGTARPDLVLADLVALLHPDRAPGHAFAFYRRVPA